MFFHIIQQKTPRLNHSFKSTPGSDEVNADDHGNWTQDLGSHPAMSEWVVQVEWIRILDEQQENYPKSWWFESDLI